MKTSLLLLTFCCFFVLALSGALPCRFAPLFDSGDLISSLKTQDSYLRHVMHYEGQFHRIGYNNVTGLTYDGTAIDYFSGLPTEPLHYWTAASKESLHMMMLALALDGNPYARLFILPQDGDNVDAVDNLALHLMELKMSTLQKWNREYPGYGGWLPWVGNYASGVVPLPAWTNSVPSLDNGEMVWALYAAQVVTSQRNDSRSQTLSNDIQKYLQYLASTARTVFYHGNGRIRAVSTIKDNKAKPTPSNYGMDCDENTSNCYLDDPYEGELFAVFMDLYSEWPSSQDRESVWMQKRAKLQAVDYQTPQGNITVQRGWWFSSHEQWKYLQLPYLTASEINRRVFMNGEKVRTIHSALNSIPGMYASVTDVCEPGKLPPNYLSATGIQSIAFQPVQWKNVITPYGAYPLFLANKGMGLAWYNHMIKGSAMQGPLGSTEAINLQGTMIAPVVTWDSKITNVVAMLGGVGDIVNRGLIRDGKLDRFQTVINREWNRVFPTLKGEGFAFVSPNTSIPTSGALKDFKTCM